MTWWDNWKNCSVSHDSNCEISGYKYNDVSCTLEYKPLLQKPKIFRRYFYRLETLFIFTKPWTINYKVGTIKVKIRGDNVKLKIKLSHGDNDPDPSRCSDHCSKTAIFDLRKPSEENQHKRKPFYSCAPIPNIPNSETLIWDLLGTWLGPFPQICNFVFWKAPLNGRGLRNLKKTGGWEQLPRWRQVSRQVFQQFASTLLQILYQISRWVPAGGCRLGPAVSALARGWLVTAAVVRGEGRWDRESSSTDTSHTLCGLVTRWLQGWPQSSKSWGKTRFIQTVNSGWIRLHYIRLDKNNHLQTIS